MTFENPLFLWASFAVLVPIIIHLFNFRKPKKVLFSDISLVKEVQRSVVKRLRLRQWLLLASRILALLALVFMFALPLKKNPNSGAKKGGKKSVAIVLDNSYSMKGGNEKGGYWAQAQKVANEIMEAYSRNDEFLIMGSGDLKLHYNFSDLESAKSDMKEIAVRQNTLSLPELLSLKDEIFTRTKDNDKVMYFVSDFQESTVLTDSASWSLKDSAISITLVPLTTRRINNVYISGSEVTSRIIEKGKPVNLKMSLVNDGTEPMKNLGVRVTLEGNSRPVATTDLAAGETKEIQFNLIPSKPGWQSGFIELDDYPVEFDNKRYFSFYVPENEKMLIVEDKPTPHLHLMYSKDLLATQDVTFLPWRNFSTSDLSPYQSIMLVGPPEITSGMQERLNRHLSEGKSILIFPGEGMKTESINLWLKAVKAGSFGQEVKVEKGISANIADLEHPLFEGMFVRTESNRKFDGPTLYRYFHYQTSSEAEQNVILRTSSQEPVLIETRTGGGTLYLFNFFPGSGWSDFTMKASGLSMMVQLSLLMNQATQPGKGQVLGELSPHKVKTQKQDVVKMIGLANEEIIPEWYAQSGAIMVKFDNPALKEGNYSVTQNNEVLEKLSFNVPDEESKMAGLNKTQLEKKLEENGLSQISVVSAVSEDIVKSVEVYEKGAPLWKYFLWFAAIFLICEFLIIKFVQNPKTANG